MTDATKKVEKLRNIIEVLRDIEPEFPAQSVYAFIVVALEGGVSVQELSDKTGLSLGAASRNVAKLADRHNGRTGLGLIRVDYAQGNYRKKVLELTNRGHALIERLIKEL